jgi:methylenetetrahydrofolate dehydrogenase (NADP+)/methenyltetrahydrofolate cyclohydrolase
MKPFTATCPAGEIVLRLMRLGDLKISHNRRVNGTDAGTGSNAGKEVHSATRCRDTMWLEQTMGKILDGTAIAAAIKHEVAEEVRALAGIGIQPGLAAVLVGHVPASEIYVRSKVQTCADLGLYSELITPDESVTTEEMMDLVTSLNSRDEIDGILIQLPLPSQVDAKALLDGVDPAKDVDGFHPVNAGRLQAGRPALAPCTPAGVMEILKRSGIQIAGQNAVVVGRSDIVGKPAAMLLLHQNATVTICHSKTRDLAAVVREADILVAAIGRPGFITAEMIKPGATIIDVGINRITDRAEFERYFAGNAKREAAFEKRGSTIVGDVHPKAFEIAGAYTPVPGGVGPLTIAMLMSNTVRAAKMRRGL